jgi:cobalamin biosynthesis Mg chelatase CobN
VVVEGLADGDAQRQALPFPDAVLDRVVAGAREADLLAFRGDPAVPAPGGPAWDRYGRAVREACAIRDLLARNTEELGGVLRALNGEFVPPAPGGDLLRDGSGVLPTGRNIHALDPFRIPSKVAMARGEAAARLTLEMHARDAGDPAAVPETVSVNLWGLEAIKTRGESVALVLALVGARPLMEATGRVVKYELIPLEELGRPRVDVLASLSGIFRDSCRPAPPCPRPARARPAAAGGGRRAAGGGRRAAGARSAR